MGTAIHHNTVYIVTLVVTLPLKHIQEFDGEVAYSDTA